MRHLSKFSYDTSKYKFKEAFTDLYGLDDLETLHSYLPDFKDFKMPNDSSTLFHKIFYSNYQRQFNEIYTSFLFELTDILKYPFYYQVIPNVRFGFPETKWLKEFHTDSEYNHPSGELNINLAITRSHKSAALQIEKEKGGEYVSLSQEYGEFTFIDHLNCRHGSIVNKEDYTLISLDFRILPHHMFGDENKRSILQGKKFIPGQYFSAKCYG